MERVNGFRLYRDSELGDTKLNQGIGTGRTATKAPWIKILKKKNELPTVQIISRIFYVYDKTGSTVGYWFKRYLTANFPPENDEIDQIGAISGFPLFNVGAEDWPADGYYNTLKPPTTTGTEYTYERPRLVDLSPSRGVIVLDFRGTDMQWTSLGTTGPPSGGGVNHAFDVNLEYLILRVKSSEEIGTHSNSPWWIGGYQWVNYIYQCDIINPYNTLDFSTKFLYSNDPAKYDIATGTIKINIYDRFPKWSRFSTVAYTKSDTYTEFTLEDIPGDDEASCDIWIFPGFHNASQWGATKIIGGMDIGGSWANNADKQYSGDLTDLSGANTGDWKLRLMGDPPGRPYIDLSGTYTDNSFNTGQYHLGDLLWCSLRSPRHMDISHNDDWPSSSRHIINFIDDGDEQICLGGGYVKRPLGTTSATNDGERYLDLARRNDKPYYTSILQPTNTTSSYNSLLTPPQYKSGVTKSSKTAYKSSSIPLGIVETAAPIYFDIYFKLLLPPLENEDFNFTYAFGDGTVPTTHTPVTFARYTDMSGITNPAGTDSNSAQRSLELINLKWKTGDVAGHPALDSSNNMIKQRITIIDVASLSTMATVPFIPNVSSDLSGVYDQTTTGNNYDLYFNVFQFKLVGKESGSNIITLNTATATGEQYDISWNPTGFIPYRYNNSITGGFNADTDITLEIPFQLSTDQAGGGPEIVTYNPSKVITSEIYNDGAIDEPCFSRSIDPSNNLYMFGTGTVFPAYTSNPKDISMNVVDNSFNVIPNVDPDLPAIQTVLREPSKINSSGERTLVVQQENYKYPGGAGNLIPIPDMLNLNSIFVSNYYQWSDKLAIVSNNYELFEYQKLVSGIIDVVNLTCEVKYLLINTANGMTTQSAANVGGDIILNFTDPVFDCVGGEDLSPSISEKPIIMIFVDGSAKTLPPLNQAYYGFPPGYPPWAGSDVSGINQDGLTSIDLASYFRATSGSPHRTPEAERAIYNGVYDIQMAGANLPENNPAFLNFIIAPSPLKVNLVELPTMVQSNATVEEMLNDDNTAVTIKWPSYEFYSNQGDTFYTITKTNIVDNETVQIHDSTVPVIGEEYVFTTNDVRIYDKYYYTVTGIFSWTINPTLTLPLGSFVTPPIFICKNNQFPFGRYNTTSTNLKLYRPLQLTMPGGQCDKNNKHCVGGSCTALQQQPNGSFLMQNLYVPSRRTGTNNNIYSNTANQLTRKQIYVLLAKASYRPFR